MRPGGDSEAALLLAPEAPYPLHGGGALRTASLLHYLARRYPVDLIVFREPGASDPLACLPAGLVRDATVIGLSRHSRRPAARALRNFGRLLRAAPPLVDRFGGFGESVARAVRGRHYRLALVEHFWCAPYWEQLAPASTHTVLDLHNVESVWHARCARCAAGPAALAHRLFSRACRQLERFWLPRFSCLLASSACDAARVRPLAQSVLVYPNAIPPRPPPARAQEHVIVFSGNLEYQPNISAARFFHDRVWGLLRERWPDLRWRLVGRNPEALRERLPADPRIQFTGPVEDAVSEIARAQVAVAPLLAGSGTRMKILEAWSAGIPVVSTSLGAEGLEAQRGQHLLLAESGPAFAEAVSALLASPALRQRLATAARAHLERHFTWPAAWEKLDF